MLIHTDVNEHTIKTQGFFATAEQKFYKWTDTLQTRHTASMKFSDIEKLIENEGRELLRLLLQAHIDLRGDGDIGKLIDGSDGIARTHKRIGERQIKSIFGVVACERMGYGMRNIESLFPKDGHLNLPENPHSYELQRRVALEVVKGSFGDAAESIATQTGQMIFKQQIEHIAISVANDFKNELASVKSMEEIKRPKPIAKRVWASVEKSQEAVITEMFDEALRRDPEKNKTWVVLVDGAPAQIKIIENEAKSREIKITIACDIIHVVEYLWKAAWAFFNKGDRSAEAWVNERFIAILEDKSSSVAAGIRRSATNKKLKKEQRESVDTCCEYLLKKSPYLKYHQYLAKGFPIATGIIEGACRYLIKDRMDITGARWRMIGAEAVLKLRSLKASGDFTAYWKFHEEQEFNRIHKSKYKKPSVINKLHIKKV